MMQQPFSSDSPSPEYRVAIVTPYCGEDVEKLRRCHDSVCNQSYPCTHFLVADSPARADVSSWQARHISLGVAHGDNGNTPRGIGAICAMNEGYQVLMFLDADNWYDVDHVASVIYTHLATSAAVVFSDRYIVFPDGEILSKYDPEDRARLHVDTSCMAIFSSAFRALSHWCLMPKELGPYCDRVMFSLLTSEFSYAWTDFRSVYFETWYVGHFNLAGRPVPDDAKKLPMLPLSGVGSVVNQQYQSRSYRPCTIVEDDEIVRLRTEVINHFERDA